MANTTGVGSTQGPVSRVYTRDVLYPAPIVAGVDATATPSTVAAVAAVPAPTVVAEVTTAVITAQTIDGFGHGLVTAGSPGPYDAVLGSPTNVTTPVRGNSTRSLKSTGIGSWVQYSGFSGSTPVAHTFYINIGVMPGQDCVVARLVANAVNYDFGIQFSSSQFYLKAGAGSITAGHVALSINTWYRVTLELDTSANPHVMRCSVDNGTEWQVTNAVALTTVQTATLGFVAGGGSMTVYYSAWVISKTDGDYETMRDWTYHDVETLRPSSDGTHSLSVNFLDDTGGTISNATTDAWQRLDEAPMQVGNSTSNTWISQGSGSVSDYFEVNLANLGSGSYTVEAVRTYFEYDESSATGASNSEARLLLSDGTEVLTTGSLPVKDSTEDPGITDTMYKRMAINPSGGWDRTKVDGLKARFGYSDGSPVSYFIDFAVDALLYATSLAATATPATVAGVASVPAPTVAAAAVVGPATVVAVASVPAPTARGGAIVAPATVAAVTAVPAPTIRGGALVAPATVAAVAAVPAPTVRGASIVAPATVAAVASVPAPTVLAAAIVAPATVVAVAAVPAPTIIAVGSTTVSPSTVVAVAGVPSPTVAGAAVVAPSTVTAVASVSAPTVLAAAIVAPPTVVAVAVVPAPTLRSHQVATPATVVATASVPAPTLASHQAVSPATVVAVATVGAPTVTGTAVVSPATVAAIGAVPAPSISAGGSVTVSPISVAAIASVPAPTVRGGAVVAPATVTAVAAVPAPSVQGTAIVSPATVAAIGAVPAPTISAGGSVTASPATVAAIAAVPAPTLLAAARVTPATVVAVAAVGAPTISIDRVVAPATVVAVALVPSPTIRGGAVVAAPTVVAIALVPAPSVVVGVNLTVAVPTVVAIALVPSPDAIGYFVVVRPEMVSEPMGHHGGRSPFRLHSPSRRAKR